MRQWGWPCRWAGEGLPCPRPWTPWSCLLVQMTRISYALCGLCRGLPGQGTQKPKELQAALHHCIRLRCSLIVNTVQVQFQCPGPHKRVVIPHIFSIFKEPQEKFNRVLVFAHPFIALVRGCIPAGQPDCDLSHLCLWRTMYPNEIVLTLLCNESRTRGQQDIVLN